MIQHASLGCFLLSYSLLLGRVIVVVQLHPVQQQRIGSARGSISRKQIATNMVGNCLWDEAACIANNNLYRNVTVQHAVRRTEGIQPKAQLQAFTPCEALGYYSPLQC